MTLSYPCAVVFADGAFTYRLFHVWGRKWWPIIVPVSSMIVMIAIIASVYFTHEFVMNDSAFIPLTSFGTNLYITGMISFKIWQSNRNMRLLGQSGSTSVISILLESAGIYTVYSGFTAVLACFLWYQSWPTRTFMVLYLGSQQTVTFVLGIAYSLMIILVAHGRLRGVRSTTTTSLNLRIERALQDEEARASNYNENNDYLPDAATMVYFEPFEPIVGAVIMVCIIYGLYVPIFCCSLHSLHFIMKDAPHRWALSWISIILYLLITTQWSFFNLKVLLRLLWHPESFPLGGVFNIFDNIRPFMYVGAVTLADGVFVYRLFHVWGRNWWVIILPVLPVLAVPVVYVFIASNSFMDAGITTLFVPLASLGSNIYITSMISYKIWQNNRNMRLLGRSGLTSIIPLLLESAGIYTVFAAFTSVFAYLSIGPLRIGSQEAITSVVGIAYSLMILLVARGPLQDPEASSSQEDGVE
ncbi:hypothetical protein ONZ45_g7004 [Pleurotus djamor]|nr:hypothetical protein ONZ45_g7004 [Pleurotus djamor]